MTITVGIWSKGGLRYIYLAKKFTDIATTHMPKLYISAFREAIAPWTVSVYILFDS